MQCTYLINTLFLTVLFLNVTEVNGMGHVLHCISEYRQARGTIKKDGYYTVENSIISIPSEGTSIMLSQFINGKFQGSTKIALNNRNEKYLIEIDTDNKVKATLYSCKRQWLNRPEFYGLIGKCS